MQNLKPTRNFTGRYPLNLGESTSFADVKWQVLQTKKLHKDEMKIASESTTDDNSHRRQCAFS